MELKDILPYITKLEVGKWIVRPQTSSHHDLTGWTVSSIFRRYITLDGQVVIEPASQALDQLGYFDEQEMLSQGDEKVKEYMKLEEKLTKNIFFSTLEEAIKAAENNLEGAE